MKPHDWMPPKGKGKKDRGSDHLREDEETRYADTPREPKKMGRSWDELSTIMEIKGDDFDPLGQLSVLALVDIDPEVKKRRAVPEFFHVKKPAMILGMARKAHVKVDDLKTVKPEHGVLVFQKGAFRIYPLMGTVSVDGNLVSEEGQTLRNGSKIQMGSAEFVFLTTWAAEETEDATEIMDDDSATQLSP